MIVDEYAWFQFDTAVEKLAEVIDITNKKYIFGIPRGGYPLAVALSHKLDLCMASIPIGHPHSEMNPNNTIVVDDICDSGETIGWMIEQGWDCYTWLYREGCKIKPKNHIQTISGHIWAVFPWEDVTKARLDYEYYTKRRKK